MWFKSRSQHADPEVRRRYVEQLPPGDESIVSAAREDPHPDVRSAAVVRLGDLATLQELADSDPDEAIRARATARLQSVLAGQAGEAMSFEQRSGFLASCDDARLLAFIARSGAEPEMRKQALERLLRHDGAESLDDLLCDVAAEDPISDMREAAARAIGSDASLAALVRRSRGHDKTIFRLAQRRLDRMRAVASASQTLQQCLEEAETLAARDSDDVAGDEARLGKLVEEWRQATAVLEEVNVADNKRFEAARERCAGRFAAARALRRARDEILGALEGHAAGHDPTPVLELSQRWRALGEPSPADARRFDKAMHAAHESDSQRDRESEREQRCREAIEEMRAVLAAERLDEKQVENLENNWSTQLLPEDKDLRTRLVADYEAARQKLRARLEREAEEVRSQLDRITALVERYERALKDGQLRDALSAHDKAASALQALQAADAACARLEARLKSNEPRMAELRRWRRWGTVRARESLCKRAEELAGSTDSPPAVARQVRELRDEWKKLDRADGAAAKPLWERFDGACEKAYAPCEAFFEEQKKQRAGNMQRRVEMCEKLETTAAATDWDNPPWRELADLVRDARRDWHKCGPVDRRQKKKIDKRFWAAVKSIESHLETMRTREVERREALITSVESIPGDADLRDAIQTAKNAQREWRPIVQADRKTERTLWKRFRAACDAVFERRKSQIEAADQERATHLAEKKAVCDQLEQMVAEMSAPDGEPQPGEVRRRVKQLRSGWQRIGPVPRDEQRAVEQRFRKACERLQQLCDEADERALRARAATMRELASRCDRFEQSLAAGELPDEAALEETARQCADDPELAPLAERCARLGRAIGGDESVRTAIADSFADNLAARRQICLELEVAADIDSPPEHQQERMAWRVNQLSASLAGERVHRNAQELLRAWIGTGAVAPAEQAAIEARFDRALAASGRR